MFATSWLYQLAYTDTYAAATTASHELFPLLPPATNSSHELVTPAATAASLELFPLLLPATNSSHELVTIKLRIAIGGQLGLVVSIASVWPAVFEVLAVKSYGAVHCLNRILDDNDPRYISTGDLILEANGHTDPIAMVHELLHRRCISMTLAKPRRADIESTVDALSEIGSGDEILTPAQLFSPTPDNFSPRSTCDSYCW